MGFWRATRTLFTHSLERTGNKRYALSVTDTGGLLLCNIRTGEITYPKFPFHARSLVATCPGLALVEVSAPASCYTFVLGNPVSSGWKVLSRPRFGRVAGLARPCEQSSSLELVVGDVTGRIDRYDFKNDQWIPGAGVDEVRRVAFHHRIAWHKGSFYTLVIYQDFDESYDEDQEDALREEMHMKTMREFERVRAEIGDVGDEETFYQLYNPSKVDGFPESEDLALFRCDVSAGELRWKKVEICSLVKKIAGGWSLCNLVEDHGRLLLYLAYQASPKPPMQRRREVQRMFELKEDGKLVEDLAWIDAAEELDSECNVGMESWNYIGYGRRSEDFFWHDRVEKAVYVHSGMDGSVKRIQVPTMPVTWQDGTSGQVPVALKFESFVDVIGNPELDDWLMNDARGEGFQGFSKEELLCRCKDSKNKI